MASERDELLTVLFHGELSLAIQVVNDLRQQADSHAISQLMHRLNQPAPTALTLHILEALIDLGDARAIPAVVSCTRHSSETVRGEALYGVISLSQRRASVMPQELLNTSDPHNVNRALTQIVYPPDLEALKHLHLHLDDPDPELRIAAAYGLGSMGAKNAQTKLCALATSDPDDDVRAAAFYAIGLLVEAGSPDCLTFLEEHAKGPWSVECQIAIARTLCFYRSTPRTDIFKHYLLSSDNRLRQLAIIGLGETKQASALETLTALLSDRSSHVQRLAAYALGRLGLRQALKPLITAASTGSAELRSTIATALRAHDRAAVTEALTVASQNKSEMIRKAVSYLTVKAGHVELLERLLSDADASVRKQATLGLAELHAGKPSLAVQLELISN